MVCRNEISSMPTTIKVLITLLILTLGPQVGYCIDSLYGSGSKLLLPKRVKLHKDPYNILDHNLGTQIMAI